MIIKSYRLWAGWRSKQRRWATRRTGSPKIRKTKRSRKKCNMKTWRKSYNSLMIRSTKSNPKRRKYWFAWGGISSNVHDFCFLQTIIYISNITLLTQWTQKSIYPSETNAHPNPYHTNPTHPLISPNPNGFKSSINKSFNAKKNHHHPHIPSSTIARKQPLMAHIDTTHLPKHIPNHVGHLSNHTNII